MFLDSVFPKCDMALGLYQAIFFDHTVVTTRFSPSPHAAALGGSQFPVMVFVKCLETFCKWSGLPAETGRGLNKKSISDMGEENPPHLFILAGRPACLN